MVRNFWKRIFGQTQLGTLGIPHKPALSSSEFEALFGFRPKEPLDEAIKLKAKGINLLFDDMQQKLQKGSWQVFSAVFSDPWMRQKLHSQFLKDVTLCPPEDIEYCRRELGYAKSCAID